MDLAVVDDLDDLLLDRLPDPLKLLRTTVECELRNRASRLQDPGCRAAVGGDAEAVGALDLHQVGQELKLCGQLVVTRERRVFLLLSGHAADNTHRPIRNT